MMFATFRSTVRKLSFANSRAASMKACIVGTGPSGFYTAKYLLKANPDAEIDLVEALPAAYGLVKSVQNDFASVVEGGNGRIAFWGNVEVGTDLSVDELCGMYNVVVLAHGASADRLLGIPGEELHGVHSAREFVAWYNGHPSFSDIDFSLDRVHTVSILGQGNVALDCARILTKDVDDLAKTDIADHALEALSRSSVERVIVSGRRGHAQASFTMKELRELTKLRGVHLDVSPDELKMGTTAATMHEISNSRPTRRMNDLLHKVAEGRNGSNTTADIDERQLQLRFLSSPVEFTPSDCSPDDKSLGALKFERMRLEGEASGQFALGTGEYEHIECDMALRSIGYRSTPLPGVPFDSAANVVPNIAGRVMHSESVVRGLYVSGWLKRGPFGIIGTNIGDAKETVGSIVRDFQSLEQISSKSAGRQALKALLQRRGVRYLDWSNHAAIERHEESVGEEQNRPRSKLVSVEELLEVGERENK